jgi:hypothetical protein
MQRFRSVRAWRAAVGGGLGGLLVVLNLVSVVHAASWDPDHFAKEDIIKLRTVCPDEGEHWFPVWLVVVERHVFIRLGSRAAARIECNTTPALTVEVAGQRFDVRAAPSPEMAGRVDAAMAAKYPSDLLIRWFSHPMVLRLDP